MPKIYIYIYITVGWFYFVILYKSRRTHRSVWPIRVLFHDSQDEFERSAGVRSYRFVTNKS